jgi:hypothetical protein
VALVTCCPPYDLSAVLIAEEAGVVVTTAAGAKLDFPLDLPTNVDWIAYLRVYVPASNPCCNSCSANVDFPTEPGALRA